MKKPPRIGGFVLAPSTDLSFLSSDIKMPAPMPGFPRLPLSSKRQRHDLTPLLNCHRDAESIIDHSPGFQPGDLGEGYLSG